MSRHPFDYRVPEAVDPAAEVDRIRAENAARFIRAHELSCTVELLLARTAEVGAAVAASEARAGNLLVQADDPLSCDVPGRSSPGTSGLVIRPTVIAAAPRRESPRDQSLQQSSPEGEDDGEW